MVTMLTEPKLIDPEIIYFKNLNEIIPEMEVLKVAGLWDLYIESMINDYEKNLHQTNSEVAKKRNITIDDFCST